MLGKVCTEVPGWAELAAAVPVDEGTRTTVIPLSTESGERWLSARAVGFDTGVVYALRDITDEHELERLRSEFVATASHELRTPLAAIYGAIRSLRRTDVDMQADHRDAFLSMIETEAERLRILVDQLLIAGRLDAGAVALSPVTVSLPPLVEEVVRAAEITAPSSISFDYRPDGASAVVADPGALRQVLASLVDNAVKYSPDGGLITIRAEQGSDRVTITVEDQGLGIRPDLQKRIFEKFFRADPQLRRGVGGTGLGLYIASALVERMGGRISVASAEGSGSTFSVELDGSASQ